MMVSLAFGNVGSELTSVNIHTNQPGAAVFVGIAWFAVADVFFDALALLLFV